MIGSSSEDAVVDTSDELIEPVIGGDENNFSSNRAPLFNVNTNFVGGGGRGADSNDRNFARRDVNMGITVMVDPERDARDRADYVV